MKNEKLDGDQETAIAPTTETTAELIPNQTADLIEKSFAENTIRNRYKHWDRETQFSLT